MLHSALDLNPEYFEMLLVFRERGNLLPTPVDSEPLFPPNVSTTDYNNNNNNESEDKRETETHYLSAKSTMSDGWLSLKKERDGGSTPPS